MIYRRLTFFILMVLPVLVGSGCSSIQSRIHSNPDYYNSLPMAHQELIWLGKITVGFHMQEVYLAWGSPSHQELTESSQGVAETWVFTQVWSETRYKKIRIRDRGSDSWRYTSEPYYVRREELVKDVTFSNNLVTKWTIYSPPLPYDRGGY